MFVLAKTTTELRIRWLAEVDVRPLFKNNNNDNDDDERIITKKKLPSLPPPPRDVDAATSSLLQDFAKFLLLLAGQRRREVDVELDVKISLGARVSIDGHSLVFHYHHHPGLDHLVVRDHELSSVQLLDFFRESRQGFLQADPHLRHEIVSSSLERLVRSASNHEDKISGRLVFSSIPFSIKFLENTRERQTNSTRDLVFIYLLFCFVFLCY